MRSLIQSDKGRWLMVLAAAIGISVSSMNTYSIGVFVRPLQAEFGWSRGDIMLGLTISAVSGTLFGPLVGLFVDRIGARAIAIFGVSSYCLMTALLGLASASIWTWWGLWTLVAITVALIKPMVWTAPVSGLFDKRRGLAMSLALCGTGLASGLAPVIAERLIADHGWRVAYYLFGGGWALVVLPFLLLFFRDGGGRAGALKRSSATGELPGLNVLPGLQSAWFVKLFLTTFLATMLIVSLVVHLVPMFIDGGMSSGQAAGIAGITGIASIVGRIGTGFMLDRWHGPRVGAAAFLLPCIACGVMLVFGVQIWSAALVAVLLGLSIGAELDIVAYLSSRYFGRRNYATLFGTITSMLSFGTAIGPLVAGHVYDLAGSYTPWLWGMIPVGLAASALVASLGDYPDYPETVGPSEARTIDRAGERP